MNFSATPRSNRPPRVATLAAVALAVALASADSAATGTPAPSQATAPDRFVTEHTVTIAAPREAVWDAFVQIGAWWHPDHTYSGDASRLSLTVAPGGCFCESLPGAGFVEHMRVVYADPGVVLRMRGGLGPLQEFAVSGALTWSFEETATGTVVRAVYRVSGAVDGDLASWADPVGGVLQAQLDRLAALIAG